MRAVHGIIPAVVLVSLALAGAAQARWTVTQSDAAGLVAEWRTAHDVLDTVRADGRLTFRLSLDDAMPVGRAGAPAVLEVATLIAVPKGMRPAVTVSFDSLQSRRLLLAPIPTTVPAPGGMGPSEAFHLDATAYGSPVSLPSVEVKSTGSADGVDIYRVTIAPMRFDPTGPSFSWARHAVLNVRFVGERTPSSPAAPVPALWDGVVLNASQARAWVIPAIARRRARVTSSPYASGTWMRVIVNTTGMYYLDATSVIAQDSRFRDAPLDHIAMFTGTGRELPRSPMRARPTKLVTLHPLVIDANNDGRFDAGDSLLFFGRAPSGWYQNVSGLYAPGVDSYGYYYMTNRYTTENVYWLAIVDSTALHGEVVGGTVTDPSAPVVDSYTYRYHEEPENANFDEGTGDDTDGPISGLNWQWDAVSAGDSRTLQPTLYDMVDDSVTFTLGYLSWNYQQVPLKVNIDGVTVPPLATGADAWYTSWGYYQTFRHTVTPQAQLPLSIVLQNTLAPNGRYSTSYLDYYELSYHRRLNARTSTFDFTVAGYRGTGPDEPVQLDITGVRSGQQLFDVTDGQGLIEYRLPPADGSGVTHVEVERSALADRRFLLTTRSDWKQPARLEPVETPADLHGRTAGVDYIVITHPDFLQAAQRLAAWRASFDGFRTAVVTTQQIYDEFSFGVFDPTAIRDFLEYAWKNWRDGPTDHGLRYVVLLGDGQYDYRNLTKTAGDISSPHPGTWVPPYEEGTLTTDDWFGIFDNSGLPSIELGRFCVRSLDEANGVVDKIISYEEHPEHGDWQDRAIFVADDEYNTDTGADNEEFFTTNSETLTSYVRPGMLIDKIYEFMYPLTAQHRRPACNKALTDAWSRGAVLLNYVGHGNQFAWAHEYIFVITEGGDLQNVQNGMRLPVLTALSCSAAHFDNPDPNSQSMAEVLTDMPTNGAIAVIGATRLVENAGNNLFAQAFYGDLFQQSSGKPCIGDAFWKAKAQWLPIMDNTRRFILIGDPATRLDVPELPVQVSVSADSLKALTPVTVTGDVRTPDSSQALSSFSGTALVTLLDSETPGIFHSADGNNTPYVREGDTMFRGEADVTDGKFSITGIIPREVVYGGKAAKAIVQVWNDQIDGVGVDGGLPISTRAGSDSGSTQGPQIQFTRAGDPNNREPLVDGAEIAATDPVRVWLTDPSGINVTGSIGHRLLAYINDDRSQPVDLTDEFVHWGSATTGWADITLPSDQTPKRIVVEAWDNRNNFSTDSVFVRIGKPAGVSIQNVIAYPDPMSDETTFTWVLGGIGTDTEADATIRIFTVAGRLVDTISQLNLSDGPVLVPWQPARQLSNGVYLYEISVRRQSDGATGRAIERLAVISP